MHSLRLKFAGCGGRLGFDIEAPCESMSLGVPIFDAEAQPPYPRWRVWANGWPNARGPIPWEIWRSMRKMSPSGEN